jgi:hypothetical protein
LVAKNGAKTALLAVFHTDFAAFSQSFQCDQASSITPDTQSIEAAQPSANDS